MEALCRSQFSTSEAQLWTVDAAKSSADRVERRAPTSPKRRPPRTLHDPCCVAPCSSLVVLPLLRRHVQEGDVMMPRPLSAPLAAHRCVCGARCSASPRCASHLNRGRMFLWCCCGASPRARPRQVCPLCPDSGVVSLAKCITISAEPTKPTPPSTATSVGGAGGDHSAKAAAAEAAAGAGEEGAAQGAGAEELRKVKLAHIFSKQGRAARAAASLSARTAMSKRCLELQSLRRRGRWRHRCVPRSKALHALCSTQLSNLALRLHGQESAEPPRRNDAHSAL